MFAANLSDTTSMSVLATLPLNEVDSEVPSPLLSDYIEMSYLALVLLIGVPLNIKVLLNLFHSLNDRNLQNSAKAQRRFTLLKIHLNISDLGILLINALGKMVWLFSYQWFGGDLMCRIFNFLNMFTLYLSSNIIVIIALDRLRNVLHAKQIRNPVVDLMVIKQLILTAYILALFWSLPQLYVWEVQNIFPDVPGGWYQCTDVWSLRKRFETIYALRTSYIDQVMFMNNSELIYNISHLVLVFWGPITILLVAYAIIAVKVIHYSLSVPGRAQQQLTCRPNVDTEQSTACVGESALESGGRLNDNDGSKDIVDRLDLEKSARRSTFPFTRQLKETLTTETENLLSTTDKPAPTEPDTTSLPSRRGFKSYSKNIPSLISGIFTKGSSKILSTNNNSLPKSSLTCAPVIEKRLTINSHLFTKYKKKSHKQPKPVQGWKKQIRSKVFRTTFLVIFGHIIFWLPFNLMSLMKYANPGLYEEMNDHTNYLKDAQYFLTIINPFLYGFN